MSTHELTSFTCHTCNTDFPDMRELGRHFISYHSELGDANFGYKVVITSNKGKCTPCKKVDEIITCHCQLTMCLKCLRIHNQKRLVNIIRLQKPTATVNFT